MNSIINPCFIFRLSTIFILLTYHNTNAYNVAVSRISHTSLHQPLSIPKSGSQSFGRQIINLKISKSVLFAEATSDNNTNTPLDNDKQGVMTKIMNIFRPKSSENLSTKELLAKMGLSALLSYGFVSNMSYCITVSLAWFGFTKKVRFF